MRFTEAAGRKVVSTSTAETVGRIDGFVVDPATRSVLALELKKTAAGDVLRWPDIGAFGSDAVTVAGADKITAKSPDLDVLGGKDRRLIGKRVLSTLGDELGKVHDVEFDPSSGTVTAFVLENSQLEGGRLIGIGSYAVVVHTDD